jgi:hypothetical protein
MRLYRCRKDPQFGDAMFVLLSCCIGEGAVVQAVNTDLAYVLPDGHSWYKMAAKDFNSSSQ